MNLGSNRLMVLGFVAPAQPTGGDRPRDDIKRPVVAGQSVFVASWSVIQVTQSPFVTSQRPSVCIWSVIQSHSESFPLPLKVSFVASRSVIQVTQSPFVASQSVFVGIHLPFVPSQRGFVGVHLPFEAIAYPKIHREFILSDKIFGWHCGVSCNLIPILYEAA
ncbi:MAG: hypothetical protein HC840_03910 [Leptolyngbyaceae cyanobacterium RM2_2_4]|nr:hypothetical protein [Leptolyngbyaceae cyanobacterium RM2_2_4]